MIQVTKSLNDFNEIQYTFERIDEDGNAWNLGEATLNSELIYVGSFDTHAIMFANDEDCYNYIHKKKPNDLIIFEEKDKTPFEFELGDQKGAVIMNYDKGIGMNGWFSHTFKNRRNAASLLDFALKHDTDEHEFTVIVENGEPIYGVYYDTKEDKTIVLEDETEIKKRILEIDKWLLEE